MDGRTRAHFARICWSTTWENQSPRGCEKGAWLTRGIVWKTLLPLSRIPAHPTTRLPTFASVSCASPRHAARSVVDMLLAPPPTRVPSTLHSRVCYPTGASTEAVGRRTRQIEIDRVCWSARAARAQRNSPLGGGGGNLRASICAGSKVSMDRLRTALMWHPRPRCTPEQRRQMKTPTFTLHHCGSASRQSAHRLGRPFGCEWPV